MKFTKNNPLKISNGVKQAKYTFVIIISMALIFSFNFVYAQDIGTIEAQPALIDETADDTAAETPIVAPEPIIEEVEDPISDDEAAEEKVNKEVFEDENITYEDFEIDKPVLLPTSPYYPIKNIWRGFRSTFTFDPLKKAKLKLRFADERIIEAKKVAEIKDRPEVVTKALKRYEKEFEDISSLLQRAPEERREEVKQFADKIIDHSFKQQRLIDGIEKRIDPTHFEKINKVKEDGIKHFAQVITHITPREEIQEKITNVIEKQRGSDFKNFKNIEVLKAIEEKVPEAARDAIRQAQDNALKRLQEKMTEINEEKRKRFKDYVDNIGGNEARHLEILGDFTAREVPDIIREEMERAREKSLDRIEEKMKKFKREEQKQEFLKHLEGGEMEDLRIIKELENNLNPETIDKVLEIKNKSMDNFRRGFEAATTEEEQDKFFDKLEEFHDVKQFEVFSEIEKIIPDDKKEFFEKMKTKAMEEMRDDIGRARDDRHREEIFERLAGDMPEHFEIFEEFGPPPEFRDDLARIQTKRIRRKIDFIEDPSKLHLFKQRIEEKDFIREELKRQDPDLFRRIEEKNEKIRGTIKKDEAIDKLVTAKNKFKEHKDYLQKLETEEPKIIKNLKYTPVFHHLENAKMHIDEADKALVTEKYGHAFGAANAALHELHNVGRMIKDSELRAEIDEGRIEEMEEIMELRDEMMGEFEEFDFDEEMFEQGELREEKMEEMMEKKLRNMEKIWEEDDQEFDEREKELFRKEKRIMMKDIFQEQFNPEETESEFKFEEEFFPEEERHEFKEVIEQLPIHIKGQLRNLPADMIPQALDRLKIKIKPMPEPGFPEPLPQVDEKPIITCPEWAPPAPGWCKDGKIIYRERDESGCERPPKCIQRDKEEDWRNKKQGEEKPLPPELIDQPVDEEPPFFEKQLKTIREDIPQRIKKRLKIEKEDSVLCIQVITPAKNPKTGECKYFPTPCDVPDHWEKVDSCEDIKRLEDQHAQQLRDEERERLQEEQRKERLREEEKIEKPITPEPIRIEREFLELEQERLKKLEDERVREDKPQEEQRQEEFEKQLREPLGEPIESEVKSIPGTIRESTKTESIRIHEESTIDPKPTPTIDPGPMFKPTSGGSNEVGSVPVPILMPTETSGSGFISPESSSSGGGGGFHR